jgi:sigma-B regulation protein RsbU (phosphoserine phosphatase)
MLRIILTTESNLTGEGMPMSDASPTTSAPSDSERAALRTTLIDRRERLVALPSDAVGPRVVSLLTEIDAALDRLEGPSFGACTRCDGQVEHDRLLVDPLTTVCLDCLTEAERRALERDLELASRVQASLLPPRDFAAGEWSGHYTYLPHGAVSGDYVDVLVGPGAETDAVVMVGDVSGKGVAAALLMSHLHAIFRATSGAGLAEMVERANRLLCAAAPSGSFATLVAARLQPDGMVELCTAGHTPPLVVTAGGIRQLTADCMPLGLFCEAPYSTRSLRLEPGDALLLATDGLTESSDGNDVELGSAGVAAALASANRGSATALVRAANDAAAAHRKGVLAHDDLTVLAVRRQPAH